MRMEKINISASNTNHSQILLILLFIPILIGS